MEIDKNTPCKNCDHKYKCHSQRGKNPCLIHIKRGKAILECNCKEFKL
jgi:hypothetical protein